MTSVDCRLRGAQSEVGSVENFLFTLKRGVLQHAYGRCFEISHPIRASGFRVAALSVGVVVPDLAGADRQSGGRRASW